MAKKPRKTLQSDSVYEEFDVDAGVSRILEFARAAKTPGWERAIILTMTLSMLVLLSVALTVAS